MWDEPYLETCCRSALHRLLLCESAGRPTGLKDDPCLRRLAERGLAARRPDGRYELTEAGAARHRLEVAPRPGLTYRPKPSGRGGRPASLPSKQSS